MYWSDEKLPAPGDILNKRFIIDIRGDRDRNLNGVIFTYLDSPDTISCCLNCPLPICIYDVPKAARRFKNCPAYPKVRSF